MGKEFKLTPEKVSKNIIRGLKKGGKGETESKKEKLSSEEVQVDLEQLTALVDERAELRKAISTSREAVMGKEDEKKSGEDMQSPEDILALLEREDDFSDINFNQIARQISPDASLEASIKENEQRLADVEKDIQDLLAYPEVADAYEQFWQERIEITRMAKNARAFSNLIEKVQRAEYKLLAHRNNEDAKLTSPDKKTISKYHQVKEKAGEKKKELMSVPEVFYEANRRDLMEYRRELMADGFVETPSVKEEIDQILAHLELGIPVFLRGHLGAGKTEILLHISRKYYGVEPEFISGSEEATKYDIYGKTQIGIKAEDDRAKEFKIRMDEYKTMFPEATSDELKKREKEFYDTIIVKGQATSFFQYGPLVRAMKEGKPVVIDEMDGIPHAILMRLNHFLTRRAGDKVKIQENGGEEIIVQKGFCVMATGNIKSAKYKREDLDPAFLSRWWSDEIKYLPADETLKVITASLVDKKGYLDLGEKGDFDAVKRLVQSAEEIQKIFTGDKIDALGFGGDAVRGIGASLEKSVLSMRDIWNIVKPWKARNFEKPLEDYIYSEFIKKATVVNDQVYLTQLFCRFGFFKDWKAKKFGISGLDETKLDAFRMTKEE